MKHATSAKHIVHQAVRRILTPTVMKSVAIMSLGIAWHAATALPALADPLPAVRFQEAPLISPTDANTYYGTPAYAEPLCTRLSLAAPACSNQRPTEIKEIATALGANRLTDAQFIQNAFEFVYNTIEFTPMFGLTKGALGALRDGHGTAFDQANLLVELLREDSTVTASYNYGPVSLTAAQFTNLTGVADAQTACRLLANGGIPALVNGTTDCASLSTSAAPTSISMAHVWVVAGGYTLDPAIKNHEVVVGKITSPAGIDSAAGLSASELNSQNIGTSHYLGQGYAGTLQTYLRGTFGALSTGDALGERKLVPYDVSPFPTDTRIVSGTSSATWTAIPDAYRTLVTVTYGSLVKPLYGDEISGRVLWIGNRAETPAATVTSPTLYLDDLALGIASSLPSGFTVAVDHPYAANSGAYMDTSATKNLASSVRAAEANDANSGFDPGDDAHRNINIVVGLGEVGRVRPDYDRLLLMQAALMPSHFGGQLNALRERRQRQVVASEWLAQSSQAARLFQPVVGAFVQRHHSLGFINDSVRWAHIDVDSGFSLVAAGSDAATEMPARIVYASFLNILEGFNIANGSGSTADRSAATTFSFNPGLKVMSGSDNVASMLQGYDSEATQFMQSYVDAGFMVVASNSSSGFGGDLPPGILYSLGAEGYQAGFNEVSPFVAMSSDGMQIAHMMAADPSSTQFIKGGAFNGSNLAPSEPGEIFDPKLRNAPTAVYDAANLKISPTDGQPSLTQTDMTVGNGPLPYSLPFTRSYSPSDRLASGVPRPGGWKNNYQLSINLSADPMAALGYGRNVPVEAATRTIVGIRGAMVVLAGTTIGNNAAFRTALAKSQGLLHLPVAYMYSNSVVAETFEGPKRFYIYSQLQYAAGGLSGNLHANVPTTDSVDTLFYGPQSFPIFPAAKVVTKSGVLYTYRQFTYAGAAAPGVPPQNGGVPAGCYMPGQTIMAPGISLPAAPLPYFPGGLGMLTQADWISGASLTITLGNDCRLPVVKVQNNLGPDNLGRTLDFSLLSNGTTLKVDGGSDHIVLVTPTEVTLPDTKIIKYEFEGPWVPDFGSTSTQPALTGSRLTKILLPADTVNAFTKVTYDDLQRVRSITDAEGRVTSHYIGGLARSMRTEIESATATTSVLRTSQVFNNDGSQVRAVDALGAISRSTYDSIGRATRVTQSDGGSLETLYDARHNRIQLKANAPPNSGLGTLVISAVYGRPCSVTMTGEWATTPPTIVAGCDSPTSVTDARGSTIYYKYDDDNRGLLKAIKKPCPDIGTGACDETDSRRPVSSYTYNQFGQILMSTDPTGVVTARYYTASRYDLAFVVQDPTGKYIRSVYYYDDVGNVCKTVDSRGAVTLNGAEGNACTSSLGSADAYVTKFEYDPNRRLTRTIDPSGAYVKNTYTPNGWLDYVEKFSAANTRLEKSSRFYRPDGKIWKTYNPECFDGAGVLNAANQNCTIVTNTYDALGRPSTVTDGVGRVVKTVYCALGDANCADGKIRKKVSAAGTSLEQDTSTYTYSAGGNRLSAMDADGNRTEYAYDGFDRLIAVRYPDRTKLCSTSTPCTTANPNGPASGYPDREEFEYDANGNRIWRRTRGGDWVEQTFDSLNRQTVHTLHTGSKSGSAQRNVVTTYDAAARVLSVTDTAQSPNVAVGYTYDSAGRKNSETLNDGTARTVDYDLDLAGNTIGITSPGSSPFTVSYAWSPLTQVTSISDGTTTFATYSYENTGLHRRTGLTFGNGRSTTYDYWPDSTLKQLLTPNLIDTNNDGTGDADAEWDFAYTQANQVKSKSLPEAFLWQAGSTQIGVKQYASNGLNQYDSVSAVSFTYDTKGNLAGDGTWTYTYDGENRLMTVAKTAGGTVNASYVYDGLDRRIAKTVNGVTTRYLWAGQNIIAEYDGAGTLLRRYVHGAGVDEPVAMLDYGTSTSTSYFHQDHAGTVVALSDATGHLTNRYTYSPYGEVGPEGVEGSIWRFTGRQLDAETGLYYYRARIYSAQLGRFLQTDPAGDKDSPNLYQYALWDPIRNKDPSGKTCTLDKFGTATCKLDQGADQLEDKGAAFNKSYTDAVNALLQNKGKVDIKMKDEHGKEKTVTVSARAVASALIGRVFVADPGNNKGKDGAAYGAKTGGNTTFVGSLGLSGAGDVRGFTPSASATADQRADQIRQIGIVHEGLHGGSPELSTHADDYLAPFGSGQMGEPYYNDAHQEPYNKAAGELLTYGGFAGS